ncbi:MAG: hypothetical protein NTV34_11795, partial [Proteobacteria bacterium]|nr:hypothetical protein [Pseudomonadota bacterium]
MTRRLRIIRSASLLTVTEILSRFLPLFIIRQTKDALGIGLFGEMQVLLTVVDVLIQLTGPGYGTVAALEIAKDPLNAKNVSRIATTTILMRGIHAVLILILLAPFGGMLASQSPAVVFGLLLLALLLIFDLEFLHSSLQKMTSLSVLILGSKIAGFLIILTQVESPSDKYLYCALVVGTNSAISLGTFFYHRESLSIVWPTLGELKDFFVKGIPFNLGLIAVGFVDRLDLMLVRKFFSGAEAGIYAIPLKLTQSISPLLISVSRVFFSEMLSKDADRGLTTKIVRIETLMSLGVLIPIAVGSYWTGAYVLNFLFSVDQSGYGPLLSCLSLSAAASLLIHIFGYQVLWRHNHGGLVIGAMVLVLTLAIVFAAIGARSVGMIGIPAGILLAKLVACAIFIKRAKHYIGGIPVREVLVILGSSIVIGCVVSI